MGKSPNDRDCSGSPKTLRWRLSAKRSPHPSVAYPADHSCNTGRSRKMAQITQSFTPEIVLMFRVATEPDRFKTTPGGAGTHGTDRDTADTGTRGPILLPQFTHDSKAKFSLRNPSPDSPHCGTPWRTAVRSTRYTADAHREHFNNREGPTNRLPVGSYSNRILLVCGVPASRGSGVVWRVSLEYSPPCGCRGWF